MLEEHLCRYYFGHCGVDLPGGVVKLIRAIFPNTTANDHLTVSGDGDVQSKKGMSSKICSSCFSLPVHS